MPTDIEKRRLSARWLGEALRETAVLVWVFVPLDWYMGGYQSKILVGAAAFAISAGLFRIGVMIGFRGELETC